MSTFTTWDYVGLFLFAVTPWTLIAFGRREDIARWFGDRRYTWRHRHDPPQKGPFAIWGGSTWDGTPAPVCYGDDCRNLACRLHHPRRDEGVKNG
jgi:hypothetical protein